MTPLAFTEIITCRAQAVMQLERCTPPAATSKALQEWCWELVQARKEPELSLAASPPWKLAEGELLERAQQAVLEGEDKYSAQLVSCSLASIARQLGLAAERGHAQGYQEGMVRMAQAADELSQAAQDLIESDPDISRVPLETLSATLCNASLDPVLRQQVQAILRIRDAIEDYNAHKMHVSATPAANAPAAAASSAGGYAVKKEK